MWRAPLLSFCSFCHLQSPSSFENSFWGNNTAVHRGGSEELGRVQQRGHQRPHRQRYAGSVPWQSPHQPASLSLLHQASWSQRCLLAPGGGQTFEEHSTYLSLPPKQRGAKTKRSLTKLPGECWRIAPRCLSCYSGFSGRLINLLAREPHGDEGFSHQLGRQTPVPHRLCILGRNPGCSAGNTGPCNTSCTPSRTRDWQGDCKEGAVGLHQCQAILLSPVTDQNQPQIRKC